MGIQIQKSPRQRASNGAGSGSKFAQRTRLASAALFALLGVTSISALAQSTASSAQDWAKGRVIVMARAGLSDVEVNKAAGAHGGKARRIGQSGLYVVDLPANASEVAVQEKFANDPRFKFAELDKRVLPAFAANDPYVGSEWHISKIGASSAWDTSQGSGVVIAILDTGVASSHPDLAANMVPGWNAFNNSSNTADFMGHGTPVAGAAAAVTNNGKGVAGVAGQAKIMPLVVTDSSGGAYYSVISQAITYAADHGARIASASFSGLVYSSAIQSAAQYMKNKGGLVVVAAGNTGTVENATPTSTMIVVSSTEPDDTRTPSSTYGAFVSVAAPGSNIYSTDWGGSYGIYGGTSFATPIVAGTIALMMAANPSLSGTNVESLLYKTAVDLGATGRDNYFGYGRIDAGAAVKAAAAATSTTVSPADTTPPTVAIAAPLSSSTVTGLVPVNVNASDNVGVSKVELRVNGALYATDSSSPFAFSWDSTKVANGMATLTAVAYDAAGNAATSTSTSVNVSNTTTTTTATAPIVQIVSPASGSTLKGKGTVTVSANASDANGSAGILQSLYIDGVLKATASGASLSYSWNVNKVPSGAHTIKVIAADAGLTSTTSIQVIK